MAGTGRRRFLGSAALALPAGMLVNAGGVDTTNPPAHPMKVTQIEAFLLARPLTDRFWMSLSPIGGMKPVARRLILKVYTDTGVVGYGEGGGNGVRTVPCKAAGKWNGSSVNPGAFPMPGDSMSGCGNAVFI